MCCDEILILSQCVYFFKRLEPLSVYASRLAGSVPMHSSPVLRKSEISAFEDCPQQISCIGLCVSSAVRQRAVPTGFQSHNEPADCQVNSSASKAYLSPFISAAKYSDLSGARKIRT